MDPFMWVLLIAIVALAIFFYIGPAAAYSRRRKGSGTDRRVVAGSERPIDRLRRRGKAEVR